MTVLEPLLLCKFPARLSALHLPPAFTSLVEEGSCSIINTPAGGRRLGMGAHYPWKKLKNVRNQEVSFNEVTIPIHFALIPDPPQNLPETEFSSKVIKERLTPHTVSIFSECVCGLPFFSYSSCWTNWFFFFGFLFTYSACNFFVFNVPFLYDYCWSIKISF